MTEPAHHQGAEGYKLLTLNVAEPVMDALEKMYDDMGVGVVTGMQRAAALLRHCWEAQQAGADIILRTPSATDDDGYEDRQIILR